MKINNKMKIGFIICIVLLYVIINIPASVKKYYKRNTFTSDDEYVRTVNLAELFNEKGEGQYSISFEACSELEGSIRVYMENGSSEDERYIFADTYVETTREFKRYNVNVEVTMANQNADKSYLSFYGIFGSGVKPTVRFIKVKKI